MSGVNEQDHAQRRAIFAAFAATGEPGEHGDLRDASDDAVFHVLVPARHWWDDIGFT